MLTLQQCNEWLVIMWVHCSVILTFPGYAFLLFQDESSVQALIDACIQEDGKLYLCVSSPTIKDKPVSFSLRNLKTAEKWFSLYLKILRFYSPFFAFKLKFMLEKEWPKQFPVFHCFPGVLHVKGRCHHQHAAVAVKLNHWCLLIHIT